MKGKKEYDTYKDNWDDTIRKIRDYSEEQFDRLIVYLNSGALILTVGFVKDIVKITSETNTFLLKSSWFFFTFSLLVILVSHKTAVKSMDLELKRNEKASTIWDNVTKVLNNISFVSFFAGIISFLFFISKSI